MGGLEDVLAAVDREHHFVWHWWQTRLVLICRCGDELIPAYSSGVATPSDHKAHVAAEQASAIRAHLDGLLTEAREDVAEALSARGGACPWDDLTDWARGEWLTDAEAAEKVYRARLGLEGA